ncbi:MAG: hypothetical protein Q9191_003328 [Dirinaria sp. TL-2023a]
MDPLSITTGGLAVIGAIKQAVECIQKLKAIHQAPVEVELLLEEVVDLHELLEHVEAAQKPPEFGPLPTESPKCLDRPISRISTKLRELDQLLQYHSARMRRSRFDFGWVRGRQRANALRRDLKLLRMNLCTSLSATTSQTVTRVESAVERFSIEHIKATQLLTSFICGTSSAQHCSENPPFEVCREDGSLHSYSGLPWVTASCDQKACQSRSIPSVAITAQFPEWFWKRYWSSSFSYTAMCGPGINYSRLPRTVSWWELWRHGIDGNLRAIQDLFSQKLASPWDVQALGGSLLHYAAGHGHWDLAKFLVAEGAILDNEDAFNDSPASLAWGKVLEGSLAEDEASMVSRMFADTDYLQTRQFTVLHKIVLRLIPRTIESELAYSTRDLNAVDSTGRTCVSWATARGDEDALKTLLDYDPDVNLPDGQGNTPLHYARNSACVDILLDAGADITVRNFFGHTPLHMVCRGTGSPSVLKRLREAGIDMNATDNSGETALTSAAFRKQVECARYLIQQGADVDRGIDGHGNAPIHMALLSNAPAILELLLAHNANYTRANAHNQTVLHLAACLGDEETVRVLITHGLQDMDISVQDVESRTAEDLLRERGDDDTDPNFKLKFRQLLETIAAAQHPVSPTRTATGARKLGGELPTEKAAIEFLKDGSGVHFTPLSSSDDDDENEDYEFDDVYAENRTDNTHSTPAVLFYDAVEELNEALRVVEITV